MSITIRRTQVTDIGQVQQLQRQCSTEAVIYGFVPATLEEIQRALSPYCFVAESGTELIGFIMGSIHHSDGLAVVPAGAIYVEIDDLYVAPQFRNQQIGGDLVEQLLTAARQADVRYALLYSATKDVHRVLEFYEAHGFQSWYVQMFQEL